MADPRIAKIAATLNAAAAAARITIKAQLDTIGTDRSFTGSMSYGAVYGTDLSSARILAHAQAAGLA